MILEENVFHRVFAGTCGLLQETLDSSFMLPILETSDVEIAIATSIMEIVAFKTLAFKTPWFSNEVFNLYYHVEQFGDIEDPAVF
ncbi:hypothetical protein CEXT_144041 [Caerostris extrusa]|uniref:Uncharacterized protein n=1 Tax=Caerostris extrusa TaxID=172846 RepID=A0AAV4NXH3_CAEEX|nr:hypothetical protein CEXT_144041 [Caerostris extrusa]